MANEKRLIYFEDAIALLEKDVADSKDALKTAYYGDKNEIRAEMNGVRAAIHILKHHASHGGTVDAVEVVHGRWIHPKGHVVSNAFFCSVCNHEEVSLHVIHPLHGGGCKADEHGNFYYPPKMNYCPNCGAKMDGGKEDG